jgi:hypothetical protein
MDAWADLFNIDIVGWSDESDETNVDFFDWTVNGEDMVWIEPAHETEDDSFCLDDIHGERCCNDNEAIIDDWIQQGTQFECPSDWDKIMSAIEENLMIVVGLVAAILGTCCICICCCCCGCRKKQPSQQQTVTVNVNKK